MWPARFRHRLWGAKLSIGFSESLYLEIPALHVSKFDISNGYPKEIHALRILHLGTLSSKNKGSKKCIFAMANLQIISK
jgi:hypothetical protein